jgi:hypothetical protein
MDKMVRRRGLPCVRHFRTSYRERSVVGVGLLSIEKKSDDKGKKKQTKRIDGTSKSSTKPEFKCLAGRDNEG